MIYQVIFTQLKLMTKIPDNCKYPAALIQVAQNQKQINKGGLVQFIKLKIGGKYCT